MQNRKKSKDPELDIGVASQMLENIFEACEVEPNSIPLSVLSSYSNYRRERFLLQKIVLVIVIILFCMIPLLFVSPKFTVKDVTSTTGVASFEVKVSSILPVDRVTAVIGGRNVTVYETADKTYSIQPARNGEMQIRVTLKNRQSRTQTIQVTSVDSDPPVVTSNRSDGTYLYVYLEDKGTGVDYSRITATGLSGDTVTPASYNETEGYVVFRYPDESLNVFIPDKAGNTLQLLLTLQKQ